MSAPASPVQVTESLLRDWRLPEPEGHGDKEERGRVLVIAGSREMPGALLLAGAAALRAGAGKLALATAASVAPGVALALPEARVMALAESPGGGLTVAGMPALDTTLRKVDVVLVGPGLLDEAETCAFVEALLPRCGEALVVLDALAMGVVSRLGRFQRPVLLTPHAGEMAHLTGASKDEVVAAPEAAAVDAAHRWNAVVALKGARTYIAAPDGRLWLHEGGNAGLGTSGSGDTLAGLITGLAGRGASLEQACVWGVALHARAGRELAARRGPLGYLARELAEEVPRLMHVLSLN